MHFFKLYAAVASTGMDPITVMHNSELPEFVTIRVPKSTEAKYLPTHVLVVHACKGTLAPRSHKWSHCPSIWPFSPPTARVSQCLLTIRLQRCSTLSGPPMLHRACIAVSSRSSHSRSHHLRCSPFSRNTCARRMLKSFLTSWQVCLSWRAHYECTDYGRTCARSVFWYTFLWFDTGA